MRDGCVIYVRISRDREGAGVGVARQERECRKHADGLGLRVHRVFTDNDLSAYSGKPRPGYLAMLDYLQASPRHVVVWHTDRLHRSPAELEHYIDVVHPLGVKTLAVMSGPHDLATASGRMVARQIGAVARYEVEHNAERIQASKTETAAAGR